MTAVDDLHRQLVAAYAANLGAVLAQAVAQAAPETLLAAADELGQQTVRAAYLAATTLAAEREAAPACPDCRRPMRRHERQPRVLCHLGGDLAGCFQRWRCRACGTAATPSYDGFIRFGCTPRALAVAVGDCLDLPFERAERRLARVGISVSDNTLQRLVGEVGGERAGQRAAEAEAVLDLRLDLSPAEAPPRLYVEADGFKPQVARRWREARCGVVYEAALIPADQRVAQGRDQGKARPERVSLVAALADCDTFAALLGAEAQRRGILGTREVVLIADGAPWIWERLRALVPPGVKVVEILDWYHLGENLHRAVKAAYGEGGNRWWLEQLQDSAWAGDTNEVLRLLASLRDKAVTDEAVHQANCVINYVRTHRHRMDYQRLDFEGYHVGSGVVESRCLQLGLRTKGPGMNWSEDGLNAILALAADELSDPAVARPLAA